MLDFVSAARSAEWYGGAFEMSGSTPVRLAGFGMATDTRSSGYAHIFREPSLFENSRRYDADDVLHTHPAWTNDGMIVGIYPEINVGSEDEFLAQVGMIAGSRDSNGVVFEFGLQRGDLDVPVEPYFNADATTLLAGFYRPLAMTRSFHDGQMETLRADLSEFSRTGRRYRPVLIVRSAGDSGKDWAGWVRPRIEPVRAIRIPQANCLLESTSGRRQRVRNRRRRWGSDEFALFANVVCLDEREVPIDGSFQAFQDSVTDVDSGDIANLDGINFEFTDPAIRYVEVRMIGLEIDGAGATHNIAQHGFNNWSGTFFLTSDGSRYEFNHSYNGPRGGNNHNLLLADYWIVDFENLRDRGRDPVGRTIRSPESEYGSVQEYLDDKNIAREITHVAGPTPFSEIRRYTAAGPDSIYEVDISYR
jgi:hypothetical protein